MICDIHQKKNAHPKQVPQGLIDYSNSNFKHHKFFFNIKLKRKKEKSLVLQTGIPVLILSEGKNLHE